MRSIVALLFIIGCTLAVSSGSDVQQHRKEALRTCELKAFLELADETVTDVYSFYNALGTTYEGLVESSLQCAEDYSGVTDLVSCVADTLTTWVEGMSTALEKLYTNIIALVEELVDDLYSCRR